MCSARGEEVDMAASGWLPLKEALEAFCDPGLVRCLVRGGGMAGGLVPRIT